MGVAPEATFECLQSGVGSFLQHSSEIFTAYAILLVQHFVQESVKLLTHFDRLRASRAALRETVEQTTGEFFLFPMDFRRLVVALLG